MSQTGSLEVQNKDKEILKIEQINLYNVYQLRFNAIFTSTEY